MIMKKMIFALMFSLLMFCIMPINVYADKNSLNAPVVRFKLINHDKIALKWDAVDGADGYLVYRTDVKTGKKYKYKPVKETKVRAENLSPETEYIFTVAPIKKNGNDIIIGEKSSGTRLTTPKEWYCYAKYDVNYETETSRSRYYRTDYAGTVKEKIDLGDIKAADEIICSDGWYYVIGDYDAITAWDEYFWQIRAGAPRRKCVARIKEDGTGKEILFDDFAEGEGFNYRTVITSDCIYIYREYFGDEESFGSNKDLIITPYYTSDFYKVSLKTGEVTKVCDVFEIHLYSFCVHDDYIYYTYKELEYDPDEDMYYSGPYEYKDGEYHKLNGDYHYALCRVKTDGTEKSEIKSYTPDDIKHSDEIYYYDNDIFFYTEYHHDTSILLMSRDDGKITNLCKLSKGIENFHIINGYIYCTLYESISFRKNETPQYCRIRISDGDTVIQDYPFDWYY